MQKKSNVRNIKYRGAGRRVTLGKREQRRLIQLMLCLGLFLVAFLGKEKLPAKVFEFIHTDTDFKSAFISFGEAVSSGKPIAETMEQFAVDVFGAEKEVEAEQQILYKYNGLENVIITDFWSQKPDCVHMLSILGIVVDEEEIENLISESEQPIAEELVVSTPSLTPHIPEYTGPALPAGATMEYFALDLSNLTAPIKGEITSKYGYRDHPIDGEYSFHTGIDVAADIGTPIAAFADGTVDFIGESEAYGLYIQLNHGNGITTFYCHCSDLFARKGECVTGGQVIASVGDSGNATGPHLHLELEREGVLLNPAYYVEL